MCENKRPPMAAMSTVALGKVENDRPHTLDSPQTRSRCLSEHVDAHDLNKVRILPFSPPKPSAGHPTVQFQGTWEAPRRPPKAEALTHRPGRTSSPARTLLIRRASTRLAELPLTTGQ